MLSSFVKIFMSFGKKWLHFGKDLNHTLDPKFLDTLPGCRFALCELFSSCNIFYTHSEEEAGPSHRSSLFTTSQTTSEQNSSGGGGGKHTKYKSHHREQKNNEKVCVHNTNKGVSR